MAAGKINLQANDGAVVGLVVPDGLTSGERQISLGVNLSGITAYHLLQGNLAVSASTITQGFNTTLYTGNGTTQSVNTGIDMDTQWGSTVEEKFGGLVWGKSRSNAISNCLFDTVRGALNRIESNATSPQVAGTGVSSFTSTGFNLGATTDLNTNTATYASWNFQTTHRVTGKTNHGKAITNHYNPTTGFGIAVYTGSGIAGHDIQTMLGRKVSFATIKNLSAASDWLTQYREKNYMYLNTTASELASTAIMTNFNYNSITLGTASTYNTLNQQYVCYYWANSYLDESNKLIGNYELVSYQGTGAAGNKVKTKGKPAWVMIKRTDAVGDWAIFDNQRGVLKELYADLSVVEATNLDGLYSIASDGFLLNGLDSWLNASGGQYIALVAYDTNSNGGGSYYPLANDTTNVQINNALIPLAQGIDSNGVKNTIISKNETITGLTLTEGKNYVYCDKNGAYGVKNVAPVYTDTFSTETTGSILKGDEYHITQNRWQTISNNPRGDLANPSLVNVFGDGSCKALYRFEGNANDESGVYNGTITNVVYGNNGSIGQSAVIPTGAIFKSAIDMNTTVTVSGWINLKNDVANGMIWAFGGDSGANCIILFCNGNGKYHITQGSYAGGTLVSINTIQLNTWVHITTVITSTEYKLYINGVLDSVYNPTSAMGNINIGFSIGGLYGSTFLDSSLITDQVRIFDKALSEVEVKSLYGLYSYTYDQTNSRNYLNHIVYADNDGGVLYVEELPKTQYFDRIETGNNRKVMYLADYGIAQIQNNKRYVLDNPFGNDRYMDCDAKLEILTTEGYWVELSHSQSQNGSGAAYSGAKAFSTQVGIVIQTGLDGFTFNAANCHIVPFAVSNTTLAQARVTIQFNGRTGRTI